MEKLFDVMYGFLIIVGGIILVAGTLLLINAFVIAQLWAWFITPLFHIRNISPLEALGISVFLSSLSTNNYSEQKHNKAALLGYFMKPIVLLVIGFLIHLL